MTLKILKAVALASNLQSALTMLAALQAASNSSSKQEDLCCGGQIVPTCHVYHVGILDDVVTPVH